MTLTIEIPALDRLCGILEDRNRWNTVDQLIAEIVKQLEAAAKNGTLEKAAKAPETAYETCADYVTAKEESDPPADIAKGESAPPPQTGHLPAAAGRQEREVSGKPVTLADVQKAAAQMRDDGKLEAVKALFPDFGIRKLSDLKGDALQGFADRLREMGARI